MNFENDFQIKYHKVLMMNELGDHSLSEEISDSAYKLSLCKKGNSGYSFGPCQWDLSNPNRKITSSIKIIDLYNDIISKIIKDTDLVTKIKDETLNHKLKPLEKLKYNVDFEGKKIYLIDLINKCLGSDYGKKQIEFYYLEEIKEQIKHVDERLAEVLKINPKLKDFLADEYIRLSILDFHNQFNFSKNGKCEKYLSGEKIQKYNSSSTIQIGQGKTKEEWTNFYYSTKYACENKKDLERRQANIEKVQKFGGGEKKEKKAPQNFQEALKIILPTLKVSKERLINVSWVGYKFTNLYQLTADECKKDEAEIVKIAQNKYKDDKKNLNIIKRGNIYQVLLKAGEYEGVIAMDSKDKEQDYFYNNNEENKIFGSVKLAYGHSYNSLNFISPTAYSPIKGKVVSIDNKTIIIDETHKSMEEVKYLHCFSNIYNSKLVIGQEIKIGDVLGQILQASKDNDDINLTYFINKVDVKTSLENIRINPVEFWNTGKQIGLPMSDISKGQKSICIGKMGTMKENINSKDETWLLHDLTLEEGRDSAILVDGYKIGHYAKKVREYLYDEKEMVFNRKEMKLENKGFSIGYEYFPVDRVLVIRPQGKPKLNIKNFSNGDHGIYLEGLVTKGKQTLLFEDEQKEESSKENTSSKKGSSSGSGTQKYIGSGAKAVCPLGGHITLNADKSSMSSGGKLLLHGGHTKSMVNLCGAGVCNISRVPPPCVPSPAGQWLQTSPKLKVDGFPALTDKSRIVCAKGGTISITAFGQTAISYGSVEASLISENAKEDERKEKNQKEGRDDKEKVPTLVTVFNKAKMEEYKKNVEVEVLLTLEECKKIDVKYDNKNYKLFTGDLISEKGSILSNIFWHGNNGESAIADGKYELKSENEKIKLGDYNLTDYTEEKDFYLSNRNISIGKDINVNNGRIVGTNYSNHYNGIKKAVARTRGQNGR